MDGIDETMEEQTGGGNDTSTSENRPVEGWTPEETPEVTEDNQGSAPPVVEVPETPDVAETPDVPETPEAPETPESTEDEPNLDINGGDQTGGGSTLPGDDAYTDSENTEFPDRTDDNQGDQPDPPPDEPAIDVDDPDPEPGVDVDNSATGGDASSDANASNDNDIQNDNTAEGGDATATGGEGGSANSDANASNDNDIQNDNMAEGGDATATGGEGGSANSDSNANNTNDIQNDNTAEGGDAIANGGEGGSASSDANVNNTNNIENDNQNNNTNQNDNSNSNTNTNQNDNSNQNQNDNENVANGGAGGNSSVIVDNQGNTVDVDMNPDFINNIVLNVTVVTPEPVVIAPPDPLPGTPPTVDEPNEDKPKDDEPTQDDPVEDPPKEDPPVNPPTNDPIEPGPIEDPVIHPMPVPEPQPEPQPPAPEQPSGGEPDLPVEDGSVEVPDEAVPLSGTIITDSAPPETRTIGGSGGIRAPQEDFSSDGADGPDRTHDFFQLCMNFMCYKLHFPVDKLVEVCGGSELRERLEADGYHIPNYEEDMKNGKLQEFLNEKHHQGAWAETVTNAEAQNQFDAVQLEAPNGDVIQTDADKVLSTDVLGVNMTKASAEFDSTVGTNPELGAYLSQEAGYTDGSSADAYRAMVESKTLEMAGMSDDDLLVQAEARAKYGLMGMDDAAVDSILNGMATQEEKDAFVAGLQAMDAASAQAMQQETAATYGVTSEQMQETSGVFAQMQATVTDGNFIERMNAAVEVVELDANTDDYVFAMTGFESDGQTYVFDGKAFHEQQVAVANQVGAREIQAGSADMSIPEGTAYGNYSYDAQSVESGEHHPTGEKAEASGLEGAEAEDSNEGLSTMTASKHPKLNRGEADANEMLNCISDGSEFEVGDPGLTI